MNNDTNNNQSSDYSSSPSDNTSNPYQGTPEMNQMNNQANSPRPGYTPDNLNQSPDQAPSVDYSNPKYTQYTKPEQPKQEYITPPTGAPFQETYQGYEQNQNYSENPSYQNPQPNGYYSENTSNAGGQGQTPTGYANTPQYNYQAGPATGTYGNAPYGQGNPIPGRLAPKKSHKWLWGFTAIPILAIAAVLCFCFVPSFKIFVYRNILGSTKYYEYVESSCPEKIVDQLKDSNLVHTGDAKNGSKSTSTLSFQSDSSTTEKLGFDLSKLSCDITTESKDKRAKMNYGLKYDGNAVANLELYADTETGKIYCKIAELSDKYLDYSSLIAALSSTDGSSSLPSSLKPSAGLLNLSYAAPSNHILNCSTADSEAAQEIINKIKDNVDPETLGKLVSKYVKFIMDDLGKRGAIQLAKNESYKLGETTEKCDKITVTLTQVQVKEVLVDVLKKAKDDETIKKIVSDITGLPTVYTTAIDSLISKVNDLDADDSKEPVIKMDVYTDGHTILGRSISFIEESNKFATWEYGMVTEKDKTTVATSLYSESEDYFHITLDSAKSNDTYSGDVTLTVDSKDYTLNFENYKVNKDGQIDGTFRLDQGKTNLTLELSSKDGKQNIKLSGTIEGTNIGSIMMDCKSEKDTSVSVAEVSSSDVVAVTNNTDLVNFLKDSKLEAFIQNIITTFHIDSTITAKQYSDAFIYSAEHQVSFEEALTNIVGNAAGDPNKQADPNKQPDSNNNGSGDGSSKKPEDYNLPSGTKIDDNGDYSYNLSDQDLEELKKKESDTKSLTKTKDEVYATIEAYAKTVCGSDTDSSTITYNMVSGNVKNGNKFVSHYAEISWFSHSSYDIYVILKYDTLNNRVIEVVTSCKDKSKVYNWITDSCKTLGIAEASGDTAKKIQEEINSDKEASDIFDLAENELYLNVKKQDNAFGYYFRLGTKDI